MFRVRWVLWMAAPLLLGGACVAARAASSREPSANASAGAASSQTLGSQTLASKKSEAIDSSVVGNASEPISNARPNRVETPFGRLLTDALRETTNAPIALVAAGALRDGLIESGPVEREALSALFSFGADPVATLDVSGAKLRAALERGLSAVPTGSTAFLHVSGLRVSFNPNAPAGQRLTRVLVGDANSPLDDRRTYTIAMPLSLAEGAGGYFSIWNDARSQKFDVSLLDALSAFFSARESVAPDEQARFTGK